MNLTEWLRAGYPDAVAYWNDAAEKLAKLAEDEGVIVTIERIPGPGPLAMRNTVARVDVRAKR